MGSYQLNNRPTFSLLILTGTSATTAGLHQPAPALVPVAVDKAVGGKREFSQCFSHGGHIHSTQDQFTGLPPELSLSVLTISCTDQSLLKCWQLIKTKGV